MDDFEIESKSETSPGVPIAPIMDMLVAIVFFLLLSSSFYDLTQQALPAKQTIKVSEPQTPPPPSPQLFISNTGLTLECRLVWSGDRGGQRISALKTTSFTDSQVLLTDRVAGLISSFKEMFPNETSLQVGLSEALPHQILISVLDGVSEHKMDVVLVSPDMVKAYLSGEHSENLLENR